MVSEGTEENRIQLAYRLPSEPSSLANIVNSMNSEWHKLYGALFAPQNLRDANQIANVSLHFNPRGKPSNIPSDTADLVSYAIERKWPNYVQFNQAQNQVGKGIGQLIKLAGKLVGLGYRGRLQSVMKDDPAQVNMCFDMQPEEDIMLVTYNNSFDCPRKVLEVCGTLGIEQTEPEYFYRRFQPE